MTDLPVLLAADDDPQGLARLRTELGRRYAGDYRIECCASGSEALAALERLREEDARVALVLADQWMPGMTGERAARRARRPAPGRASARCSIDWGAWGDARDRRGDPATACRAGDFDYYVLKPWRSPDELFHRTVAEFLHEWSRAHAPGPEPGRRRRRRRGPRARTS